MGRLVKTFKHDGSTEVWDWPEMKAEIERMANHHGVSRDTIWARLCKGHTVEGSFSYLELKDEE